MRPPRAFCVAALPLVLLLLVAPCDAAPLAYITTVAGHPPGGFSGDGGAALDAELSNPYGVAVTAAGDVLIADTVRIAVFSGMRATMT